MANDQAAEGQRFSFWKAAVYSFFSKDLYADVGENWKGKGYKVLFLMILILSILRSMGVQWDMYRKVPEWVAKIPPFRLEKGVFSSEVAQPYRIDFPGGAIVIDTTGKYRKLIDVPGYGDLKSLWLITKTRSMNHKVRITGTVDTDKDLPQKLNWVFDREKLDRWGDNFIRWSGTFYFVFLILFWSLANGITLLLYGLLGVFFADLRKGSLDYPVALRLAAVSHFPAMIGYSLVLIFWGFVPWSFLWTFLVSVGYLFFAVSSQSNLDVA